jgi:hypothetical protein
MRVKRLRLSFLPHKTEVFKYFFKLIRPNLSDFKLILILKSSKLFFHLYYLLIKHQGLQPVDLWDVFTIVLCLFKLNFYLIELFTLLIEGTKVLIVKMMPFFKI